METVEYARGRKVDIYGDPARRAVLMWHGAQTDARVTMTHPAQIVADHGFTVAVPDWNSHADDRGRDDLIRSLEFVRDRGAGAVVLVGWSMGGVAAAGATINAAELGVPVTHAVCLAGAFMVEDPISGRPLPSDLPDRHHRAPFTLLHGDADDVIPPAVSRNWAATLERNGWPVNLVEIHADHGSIAGATYRRAEDRYVSSDDPAIMSVAHTVAKRIIAAASD